MDKRLLNEHEKDPPSLQPHQPFSWTTGFWKRFPYSGLLALFIALGATVSMICIISTSNGQPITSWRFQPTVCLAISYTIANIALQYALAQAVTIAWWVKALKGDAKVQDLHNIWAFGHGVFPILRSGRSFNLVALAGLAVTLAPINGPLLQRASVIHERTRIEIRNITLPIAQEFPDGYTGDIAGRGSPSPSTLSVSFGNITKQHNNRLPINVTNSGCSGLCKGTILGAGYQMDCHQGTTDPYSIVVTVSNSSRAIDLAPFTSNFSYIDEFHSPYNRTVVNIMNFTTTYKDQPTCVGELKMTNCIIRPATVAYPVILTNDTIALDPDGSWKTDKIHKLRPPMINTYIGRTTHGGMYLYLNNLYNSNLFARFVGQWSTGVTGSTAFRYIDTAPPTSNGGIGGGCEMTFSDPTFDILSTLRELAFRTALYVPHHGDVVVAASGSRLVGREDNAAPPLNLFDWKEAYLQPITVEQTRKEIVFKSQYQFLAIALAITLVAMGCVLAVLSGWWQLGREVSLSPIEIARAFNAPLLSETHPNAEVEKLLKECGGQGLRYGAVWENTGHDETSLPTLRLEKSELCEKPRHGQVFGRQTSPVCARATTV